MSVLVTRLIGDYVRLTTFQKIIFWASLVGVVVVGIGILFETNFGVVTFIGTVIIATSGAFFTSHALVMANREPIRNEMMCVSYIVSNWAALCMVWFFVLAVVSGVTVFVYGKVSIPSYLGLVSILTIIVYTIKPIRNFQNSKNQ